MAADIITLQRCGRARVKPRLRFDKVVIELIGRLKAGLDAAVPDGRTVVVTCTAPIRLSGKTAEALTTRILAALARDAKRDVVATINDNAVRVRFVDASVKGAARVVGFVHNPDPGAAETLHDMTEALIEALANAKPKPNTTLTLVNPGDPLGQAWVHVYRAIDPPLRHADVVMTFADGTVQTLSDEGK